MTGHEIVGGRLRSYGNDGYGADCTCGYTSPLTETKDLAASHWYGHAVAASEQEYKRALAAGVRR